MAEDLKINAIHMNRVRENHVIILVAQYVMLIKFVTKPLNESELKEFS